MIRIISITLIALLLLALKADKELIEWNEQRPLTWDDFVDQPDKASPRHAETHYEISFSFSQHGNEYKYEVICCFIPEKSWVKKDANDYLLNHEQVHFDIAEVFARMMRKDFDTVNKNTKDIQGTSKKIYREIMSECNKFQKQYDKETNHSINEAAQHNWNKKIASMLTKYKDYKRE